MTGVAHTAATGAAFGAGWTPCVGPILGAILTLASTLVPDLAEATVTASWSNFRPYTEDHLPVLGETGVRGLVLATGHFRNGILLAPATAQAIAELVATGRSGVDLTPFSVERFRRG